jgi:hypothetical protein
MATKTQITSPEGQRAVFALTLLGQAVNRSDEIERLVKAMDDAPPAQMEALCRRLSAIMEDNESTYRLAAEAFRDAANAFKAKGRR